MKKSLGQHFLLDEKISEKIVSSLDIKKSEIIIEIGPGDGALTKELIKSKAKKIILIEKDRELIDDLEKNFENKSEIICGDALKDLEKIIVAIKGEYKLVGNIPYYITGKLLRVIGELKKKPSLIVLMMQKEVGQRLTAQKGKMNLLSGAVQFWAEPKMLFLVNRDKFKPSPKVDSMVIELRPKEKINRSIEEKYYQMLKIAFKQPRKTLVNNLFSSPESLKIGLGKNDLVKILNKVGLEEKARPQDLTIEKLEELAILLKS